MKKFFDVKKKISAKAGIATQLRMLQAESESEDSL